MKSWRKGDETLLGIASLSASPKHGQVLEKKRWMPTGYKHDGELTWMCVRMFEGVDTKISGFSINKGLEPSVTSTTRTYFEE